MFCGNCGRQIADNAVACPFCNTPVRQAGPNTNAGYNPNTTYNPNPGYNTNAGYNANPGYNPNAAYNASNPYNQNFTQPSLYPAQPKPSMGGAGIASIIVGAIGILIGWFLLALLGYIFGGVALGLSIADKKKSGAQGIHAGMIVAIVCLAGTLVNSIIGVIMALSLLL